MGRSLANASGSEEASRWTISQSRPRVVYPRKHARRMAYSRYRRQGKPIGSGVTEAACKTVFSQRLKQSGMRWEGEGG